MTHASLTRRLLGLAAGLLVATATLVPHAGAQGRDPAGPPATPPGPPAAPPVPVTPAPERGIAEQYIVVLKAGANAQSVAGSAGVNPRHVYSAALNGFAAALNQGQLTALQHNPNVAFIEQDAEVSVTEIQQDATWGIDRIDQRNRPLDGKYNYTSTGTGVRAYIIDTGIRLGHAEFSGRARLGTDVVGGTNADGDCHGHGTHVAGTVGGETYGVAENVDLIAVRVLDCAGNGTWAGVIAGIEWVTANHAKPAVANMSLGGGASSAVDTAVKNSIAAGVTYAIAAGNGNIGGKAQNACNYSPARVPEAITVSATDSTDKKASFANYGSCVDVFAPGVSITSAGRTSDTATATMSGTSMAAPHVAGVAALFLQGNPGASPAQVRDALVSSATSGKVTAKATESTPSSVLLYSCIAQNFCTAS